MNEMPSWLISNIRIAFANKQVDFIKHYQILWSEILKNRSEYK